MDDSLELKKAFNTLFSMLKKRYLIIILFLLLGIFFSFLYNNSLPKTYKSFTTLYSKPNLVYEGEDNYYSSLMNMRQSKSFIAITKSRKVIETVIEKLNLDYEYEFVLKNLNINIEGDSDVITLSYFDLNNEKAKNIANEITNVAISEANNIMDTKNIVIIDNATISNKYDCKKNNGNIIIGALMGIILGFSIGFFLDLLEKNDKKSKK